MPPPSDHASLTLALLPALFFVVQMAAVSADMLALLAAPNTAQGFFSVTRTGEEVSVVGQAGPDGAVPDLAGGTSEAKWRCIRVKGPMDFGLTGIMAALTDPLARAGVPVFALSTWNTDYVLVPKEKAGEAVDALTRDGWAFA